MGMASYEIIGSAGEWRVSHDGKAENVYQTRESAFEAAVTAASLALRQGHEVRILAPRHGTATGAANPGQATGKQKTAWEEHGSASDVIRATNSLMDLSHAGLSRFRTGARRARHQSIRFLGTG